MRIIGTVLFVLIAGISSSTNAQADLQPFCTEIGAPNAVEVVNRATDIFSECLKFSETAGSLLELDKIPEDELYELLCDRHLIVNKCLASLTNTYESCVESKEEYPFVSFNIIVSFYQFACDNHKLGKDSQLNQAAECLQLKYKSSFDVCVHNVFPKDSAYTSSSTSDEAEDEADRKIIRLLNLLNELSYNVEECSMIQHFEQCLISKAYEVCDGDALPNYIASFANYNNKKSLPPICNIPTLTSVASPGVIVNFLLLSIAVTAMCL